MKRRTFLSTAALASLATLTPAASIWSLKASAQGTKILTLSSPAGFPDLDPSTSFSNDGMIVANCYETLTRYIPAEGDAPAKVEPLLAESWSVSDDGMTWTFKLRSGVKFHDGADFNAEAVKLSIERTKKLNGGAAFIWLAVKAIETPDATTVVMKLEYPQPMDVTAAAGFAAWMISPKAIDKDNAWFNKNNNAGTGAYMIENYEPGQRAILTKFDGYWGGWKDGNFDKAVFEIIEDATLSQRKIEAGESDWAYSLPYDNLEALRANPDLSVVSNASFQTLVGLFNTQRAPLDKKEVRQALAMAFPYDDVIKAGTAGIGTRAKGVIPPGVWGHDKDAPIVSMDIDKAKSLLDGAGVKDLTLTMTFAAGDTLEQTAGELWKANLAKIGVTLNLQPMAWEAQWSLAKADPAKAQDIFVMYWWPTFVTPYDYFFNMFRTEAAPNFNLGYYKNAEFDKVIDEANGISGTDRAKAEAGFKVANKMLIEDAAAVFMIDTPNVHVIRSDVKGYSDNPAYGHIVFVHQLSR